MNRNYECLGKYVGFLLDRLLEAKDMEENDAYSIIGRYTSRNGWASGYGLLCTYGDYADTIYTRINDVLNRLPDSDRNDKARAGNKATYEYIKSEEYINDCKKYNGKKIVVS